MIVVTVFLLIMNPANFRWLPFSPEIYLGFGTVPKKVSSIELKTRRQILVELSERLAYLGIMGDQLRAPLKPLNTIVL